MCSKLDDGDGNEAHRRVSRRRARRPESAEEQHRVETIAALPPNGKCLNRYRMRKVSAMARNEETATPSEERAARNEVLFREANEKLGEKRQELDIGGLTPFLCECGDPSCTEVIVLRLEEYEHVRSHGEWFLVATGHRAQEAFTAEEHGAYEIIEKSGIAGRIAREENPRE
jgi:hypothetical protein